MCGIAGIFDPRGQVEPDTIRETLEQAARQLRRRGPDGHGVTLLEDQGVGMAHTRLSIIDLDPRSNQPMRSVDGRSLISFNGEIYNYRALRTELQDAGLPFRTDSDTEVLLQGYAHWGMDGLLERLCGMFAFALHDSLEGQLFLVRDRFAKKPLFYFRRGSTTYWASEIRSLLAVLPERPGLSPEGLDAFLTLKFSPARCHLLEGVRSVPAATVLRLGRTGEVAETCYWNVYRSFERGVRVAPDEIEDALRRSVNRRLVSDVPVCTFLSGGIDSSLITAMAAQELDGPLKAYCVGYRDHPESSEFEHARVVAKRYGLDYEEIFVDDTESRDLLFGDDDPLDEPISDWVWVPLHFLCRRARDDGFKVALVGEGSDEVFFGYNSMAKRLKMLQRNASRSAKWRARAARAALGWMAGLGYRGHRTWDLWRRHAEGDPLYMGSSFGVPLTLRPRVVGPRMRDASNANVGYRTIADLLDRQRQLAGRDDDLISEISYTEIFGKMSEILLRRVDRIAMHNSLEARAPFLDHELVEKVFCIPGPDRIQPLGKKSLLKRFAPKYIPDQLIHRPKMGFSFPFSQWLRGDLGDAVRDVFESGRIFSDGWLNKDYPLAILEGHRKGGRSEASRIWMLYSLARWYERWVA